MNTSHLSEDSSVSIKKRIFSLPTLLSFVTAVCLIYFLTSRFELDWSETGSNIKRLNPLTYIGAFLIYYSSFLFRGFRWRYLGLNAWEDRDELAQVSSSNKSVPSPMTCSLLILCGWFVNSIAWLRMGDAYRAYAFGSESGKGFSWSLGTILAERVLDMVTVATALIISVFLLSRSMESTISVILLVSAIVMTVALIGVVVGLFHTGSRITNILPNRLKGSMLSFKAGVVGSFDRLPLLAGLGSLGWLMEVLRLWLVVESLGISMGFVLLVVVAVGSSVLSTIPTPGGVGAVEPGMTALLLLGVNGPEAAAVTLCDRSITYLSVLVIGGLVFFIRQTRYFSGKRASRAVN